MDTEALIIADYIYYTCVVVVAITGNSLVIISIIKFHTLRSNANYLVGGLALSDFLMACSWPPLLGKYSSFFLENSTTAKSGRSTYPEPENSSFGFCAKILEYIRGPKPSHLICIV